MAAKYHAHFTPSLMSAAALEATFVQRHQMLTRLLDLIHDSALGEAKHHTLLVGPRGIGKTHLVSLLYHRVVTDDKLRDCLRIAWLREEEWGVASYLDLLLRILRALDEEYQDTALRDGINELYDRDRDSAMQQAQRLLREWLEDKTLLLLVENLDDLFAGLGSEGQKQLRALIQNGLAVSVLATTPALFQGVSRKISPFYGFFRIRHLDRLNLDEAVDLVVRSLRYRGKYELAEEVTSGKGRARIRVIHHLAGGNHRIYSIFSQFLTVDSLDDIIGPVLRTFDDLTPYYQAKVAQLAPLQRKIVEALCEKRGAASVQHIARLCFVSPQTVSRQLTTLRQLGYVISESYGRQSFYDLSEPLMRLSVEIKKSRGEPVRLLVNFLRLWFSSSMLETWLGDAASSRTTDRKYLELALTTEREDRVPTEIARQETRFKSLYSEDRFEDAITTAEKLIEMRGGSIDWCYLSACLRNVGKVSDALRAAGRSLELDPSLSIAWDVQGAALDKMGQHFEAVECKKRAVELDPGEAMFHNSLGVSWSNLREYRKSQEAFDKAAALAPGYFLAWMNRGECFARRGRYSEAVSSLSKAIKIDDADPWPWLCRGVCQWKLGRRLEALEDVAHSLRRSPRMVDGWINYGYFLLDCGLFDLAITCVRKASGLTPRNSHLLGELAVILYRSGRRSESLSVLEKSLSLESLDTWLLNNHGVALFSLGKYDRAITSFDSSIKLRGDVHGVHSRLNRAMALLATGQKTEGTFAIDEALGLLTEAGGAETGDDTAIVRNLLMSVEEPNRWRTFVKVWIDRFEKHQAMAVLGHGLVHSIPAATSEWLLLERAVAWLKTWRAAGDGIAELRIPLRLLEAAVEFRRSLDPRILYSVAKEEREILKPLLRCLDDGSKEVIERRAQELLQLAKEDARAEQP